MSFIQAPGEEDAFGKLIADGTTNNLNIPSHFPINRERLRLFVNGSPAFPDYGTVSQYNFNGHIHELQPSSGDTVILESTERPSYQVQAEFRVSAAFSFNQALQSGDVIRFGLYNDDNGWFIELNSNVGAQEAVLVIREGGTDVVRKTVSLPNDPQTALNRYSLDASWYRVGRAKWQQFFTDNGEAKNELVGKTSIDTKGGPEQANLPLRYEVTAGSGTGGLVLEAGSVAHSTLAQSSPKSRTKDTSFSDTTGTSGAWDPVRAFRINPNSENVRTVITDLVPITFSVDADVDVALLGFDKSNVSFSSGSWGVPNQWTSNSNALQTRTDINTIVDSGGNSVSAPTNPGGYSIMSATLAPLSGEFQKGSIKDIGRQKTVVPARDIAVIAVNANKTGDLLYSTTFDQEW